MRQAFNNWRLADPQPRTRADGKRAGRVDGGLYVFEQFTRHVFPVIGDVAIEDLSKAAQGKVNRQFIDPAKSAPVAGFCFVAFSNPSLPTLARGAGSACVWASRHCESRGGSPWRLRRPQIAHQRSQPALSLMPWSRQRGEGQAPAVPSVGCIAAAKSNRTLSRRNATDGSRRETSDLSLSQRSWFGRHILNSIFESAYYKLPFRERNNHV